MSRSGVVFVQCVSLVAIGLLAPTATANMAAPQHHPSTMAGPQVAGRTPLVIDKERLTIDCFQAGKDARCHFEATYWVRNPTMQPVRVTPGFLSERTEDVAIFVEGVRVDRELAEPEAKALVPSVYPPQEPVDPTFAQPPSGDYAPTSPGPDSDLMRMSSLVSQGPVRGFDLEVLPGAVREVTARGRLVPGEYWEPKGYFLAPVTSRHPLLAPEDTTGFYAISYFVAPIRTWGAVGPIEVSVRHPSAWQARISAPAQMTSNPVGNDMVEVRFVTEASQMSSLEIGFELPRRRFHPGGPIVGIGGTFGDAGGFRMRFGWGTAAPEWLLYTATADTDFGDRLVLTPMVEAATPWFYIIPSLAAGVGIPVRLKPDTEVGVRLQTTAAFGPVAWVTSFDFFPGMDADLPDDKQVTMLLQLSL
jgi:hypothetical protein